MPRPSCFAAARAAARVAVAGAAVASSAQSARAQSPAIPVQYPTPAEQADYLSFTSADEVMPYLENLAEETGGLEVGDLGTATARRVPIARLHPVAGAVDTAAAGPVIRVLIVGAQHGTERAGFEAGLRVVRELAAGRLAGLRGSLDVRVVPMLNAWGVENRRRENSEGLDLDADHIRLEAAETRALWAEYVRWRPHLVLDLHEVGPSEYTVQVGVPTHPNAPAAAQFARFYLLPYVANELARSDVRFHEYAAGWQNGRTTEAAATPAMSAAADGADSVWFSPAPFDPASARNAFALAGSVAYFVAVASSRDILGLEERTDRMYATVESFLAAAAGLASELEAAVQAATALPKSPLSLVSRYVSRDSSSAMPWIYVNSRGQIEQGRLKPWRSQVEVVTELSPPEGWWLDAGQARLVAALEGHGFRVESGASGPRGPSLAYASCPSPADGADGLEPTAEDSASAATWVPAGQPGGRLLFTILEPWSEGGWFGPAECGSASSFPIRRAAP